MVSIPSGILRVDLRVNNDNYFLHFIPTYSLQSALKPVLLNLINSLNCHGLLWQFCRQEKQG